MELREDIVWQEWTPCETLHPGNWGCGDNPRYRGTSWREGKLDFLNMVNKLIKVKIPSVEHK